MLANVLKAACLTVEGEGDISAVASCCVRACVNIRERHVNIFKYVKIFLKTYMFMQTNEEREKM